MNYEDSTDLLPPDAVVGHGVLERVQAKDSNPLRSLRELGEPQVADQVAQAVIATFIASEAADGAPEPALAAERDAAECGYVFGELLLGPTSGRPLGSDQISSTLNRMYLFGLLDLVNEAQPSFGAELASRLAERASRVPGTESLAGALEEALPLAWCIGFGTAAILADGR